VQKKIVTGCSSIALLGFIAWFYSEPSFEPAIGLIVSVGALASSHWPNKKIVSENPFDSLWNDLAPLLTEMKQDMENPKFKLHRFFWLLDSRWMFNHDGPYLVYHLDKLEELDNQISILESHGYITDVSEIGKNVKKYKFSEDFVQHLRDKKI
jgi:hypothetical protein